VKTRNNAHAIAIDHT